VEALAKMLQGVGIQSIDSENKRERDEWVSKAIKLGVDAK
jgi:hypothetical protein